MDNFADLIFNKKTYFGNNANIFEHMAHSGEI